MCWWMYMYPQGESKTWAMDQQECSSHLNFVKIKTHCFISTTRVILILRTRYVTPINYAVTARDLYIYVVCQYQHH